MQHEIGRAYTLALYPPALWTTATVQIVGPDNEDLVAETAATVATVNQAITVGARGQDRVTVAATTGLVVGRQYLLVVGGMTQEVLIVSIVGNVCTLDSRLRQDSVGGAIRDHRVTFSATAPTAVTRACQVIWRGVTTVRQVVDFVVRPFSLNVSTRDVDAIGSLFGILGDDYGVFERVIEQAVLDIEAWLRGRGIAPDLVIERALLERAAAYRAAALRIKDPAQRETLEREYRERLALFSSSRSWVDLDENSARTTSERPPPKYARIT